MITFYWCKHQKTIGWVLIALSGFGFVTALIAFVELLNCAQRVSASIFAADHFAILWVITANQLTFAPLVLPGISFLRNRVMILPAIFVSFCLGVIPAFIYFYCLNPYYSYRLDRISELSPLNYGSIFALAAICLGLFLWHLYFPKKDG